MSINDYIQEGSAGLIIAVDKLDWERLERITEDRKNIKIFSIKKN